MPTFFSEGGRTYIRRERKYVSIDGLPFDETSVSKMIGFTPNYVGYAPSKKFLPNYNFQKFLSKGLYLTDEEKKAVDTQRVVWTGGYDTYTNVLRKFMQPSEEKLSASQYLDILEEENFPWLHLPRLEFPTEEDISNCFINPDAHPGFFTKLFFGDKRKDTVQYSVEVAKSIYRHLKHTRFAWQGLWTLGGRSKDVKVNTDMDENIATRPIWIPEEPLVLLSLPIVQKVTYALKEAKVNCIFIGKNFTSVENRWIRRMKELRDFQFRCDWTNFDSDVTPGILLAAFALLRSVYPEDRSIDRYFSFLYDTVLNKNVVIPPGFIYRISKGMPSGHPLVSLINTLINYISWIVILQKVYGKGKVASSANAIFGGDDTQIFCDYHPNLYNIDKYIKDTLPLHTDSVVSSIMPTESNWEHEPNCRFFKRYTTQANLTSWHIPSIFRKFIYNEHKFLHTPFHTCKWICSVIRDAPGNVRLNNIFREYMHYIVTRSVSDPQARQKDLKNYLAEIDEAVSVGMSNQLLPLNLLSNNEGLFLDNFLARNNRKHISHFLTKDVAFYQKFDMLLYARVIFTDEHNRKAFLGLQSDFLNSYESAPDVASRSLFESAFATKTQANLVLRLLSERVGVPRVIKDTFKGQLSSSMLGLSDIIKSLCAHYGRFKKVFPVIFQEVRSQYIHHFKHVKSKNKRAPP